MGWAATPIWRSMAFMPVSRQRPPVLAKVSRQSSPSASCRQTLPPPTGLSSRASWAAVGAAGRAGRGGLDQLEGLGPDHPVERALGRAALDLQGGLLTERDELTAQVGAQGRAVDAGLEADGVVACAARGIPRPPWPASAREPTPQPDRRPDSRIAQTPNTRSP